MTACQQPGHPAPDQQQEMDTLEMTLRTAGRACVISLSGSANNETSAMLEQGLMEAARSGQPRTIVDASALMKITSAGLRSLLTGARAIEASGGVMILAGAVPQVARVLDLTGLGHMFQTSPSLQAALEG